MRNTKQVFAMLAFLVTGLTMSCQNATNTGSTQGTDTTVEAADSIVPVRVKGTLTSDTSAVLEINDGTSVKKIHI